ncbi:hypothetical protein N7490_001601 [Penicillium lividum]|nr:hypothetical protein N7490_001601 [Penicillium lividum]
MAGKPYWQDYERDGHERRGNSRPTITKDSNTATFHQDYQILESANGSSDSDHEALDKKRKRAVHEHI